MANKTPVFDPDAQSKKMAASMETLSRELSQQTSYPTPDKLPKQKPGEKFKPAPRQEYERLKDIYTKQLKMWINMRLKMRGFSPIDWEKLKTIH